MNTPVVTILGHVDHGKTTLLDTIRGSDVAASESGGITQKIGAFQIEFKGKKITFIDTPGHEAFAKMRSRGASVADIAILVVAAPDGVQPQTKESIAHILASEIPFIVAITKIDMPNVSIDKVKRQLADSGVQVEGFGGDIVCIPVSAKEKIGIDELLDMILLIWEMKVGEQKTENGKRKPEDSKTEKKNKKQGNTETRKSKKGAEKEKEGLDSRLRGNDRTIDIRKNPLEIRENQSEDKKEENKFVVIESYRDNKKGTVVHAIVKSGKFKTGDTVFIGEFGIKIKALINDKGQKIEVAEAGDPVEILGFNEAAEVGVVGSDKNQKSNIKNQNDNVKTVDDEKQGNAEAQNDNEDAEKSTEISENPLEIRENPIPEEEKPPELKKLLVILRADNQGSLEAIRASLPEEIQLIFVATGNLTESDVLLAKTTKAIVVGFNTNVFPSVSKLAETEGVMIQTYTVIYKMLEELQEVADSINEVTATEKIIGRAEIVQDFLGTKSRIAGCKIREGKFLIGDKVRVERGEKVIGEAKIESIKSFKKDVQKIVSGEECGIVLVPEVDFRVKDFIISAKPLGIKK